MSEEIITETNRETATDHEYGGAQIQVLEGLEAVRKRPGMYIGSTGPSGLHHLVYEIVDNAIDEALAGYCTHIEVSIKPGNIIEVSDNGRGIPVDIQPKMGIPAVTVVPVDAAGPIFFRSPSGFPRWNRCSYSAPSRRTRTTSHSLRAFTTLAPTPCRPPATL